jgi:S1-C subfamily serine protease
VICFLKHIFLQAAITFITVSAVFSGETLSNFQKEINQLVDSCKVSVVTVSARFSRESPVEKESGLFSLFKSGDAKTSITNVNVGTGIIFDKLGHILTRSSIVLGAESTTVTFIDGKEAPAQFVGGDPESGFAVLKLKVEDDYLPMAKLGDSDEVTAGAWILAIGNSLGAFPSVTMGALNGIRSDGLLQITANLNLGNNGSPIFNLSGEVVGLVAGRLTPPYLMPDMWIGESHYELFVAYPINWIKKVANDIIEFKQVRRGWIGAFGSYGSNGLKISRIKEKSPAQQSGLLEGDIIVKFSDKPISSVSQLARLVEYTAPGQKLPLEYIRAGQRRTVEIEIGEKLSHKSPSPITNSGETMVYFDWPSEYEVVEKNQALELRIEQLEKEIEKLKKQLESK